MTEVDATPIAVEIHQHKRNPKDRIVALMSRLIGLALSAFLVWIIAPAFGWHPNYGVSILAILLIQTLLTGNSPVPVWYRGIWEDRKSK